MSERAKHPMLSGSYGDRFRVKVIDEDMCYCPAPECGTTVAQRLLNAHVQESHPKGTFTEEEAATIRRVTSNAKARHDRRTRFLARQGAHGMNLKKKRVPAAQARSDLGSNPVAAPSVHSVDKISPHPSPRSGASVKVTGVNVARSRVVPHKRLGSGGGRRKAAAPMERVSPGSKTHASREKVSRLGPKAPIARQSREVGLPVSFGMGWRRSLAAREMEALAWNPNGQLPADDYPELELLPGYRVACPGCGIAHRQTVLPLHIRFKRCKEIDKVTGAVAAEVNRLSSDTRFYLCNGLALDAPRMPTGQALDAPRVPTGQALEAPRMLTTAVNGPRLSEEGGYPCHPEDPRPLTRGVEVDEQGVGKQDNAKRVIGEQEMDKQGRASFRICEQPREKEVDEQGVGDQDIDKLEIDQQEMVNQGMAPFRIEQELDKCPDDYDDLSGKDPKGAEVQERVGYLARAITSQELGIHNPYRSEEAQRDIRIALHWARNVSIYAPSS